MVQTFKWQISKINFFFLNSKTKRKFNNLKIFSWKFPDVGSFHVISEYFYILIDCTKKDWNFLRTIQNFEIVFINWKEMYYDVKFSKIINVKSFKFEYNHDLFVPVWDFILITFRKTDQIFHLILFLKNVINYILKMVLSWKY